MKNLFGKLFVVALLCEFSFAAQITPKIPSIDPVDNCYEISNAAELYGFADVVNGSENIAKNPNACGKLVADVVVNDYTLNENGYPVDENGEWIFDKEPLDSILVSWNPLDSFSGVFDGQNHIISGLYYSSFKSKSGGPSLISVAFGGTVENPVVVKNLGLVNGYFASDYSSAFINKVSENSHVIIDNCFNEMSIDGTDAAAAFVVYALGSLKVTRSYNKGIVFDADLVAGFVVTATDSLLLLNTYNIGTLSPRSKWSTMAGLIGRYLTSQKNGGYLSIENSYSLTENLVHYWVDSSAVQIKNSYQKESGKLVDVFADEELVDGSLAKKLHYSPNGEIWGQEVGKDSYPVFSENISNGKYSLAMDYSLKFITYEGDTAKYISRYVKGTTFTLPKATRDGYAFAGWYVNDSFDDAGVTQITANDSLDKVLYAKWLPEIHPVNGCYEIKTVDELFAYGAIVNGDYGYTKDSTACGKLMADISFLRAPWIPMKKFAGTFDGNGYTISNLRISQSENDDVGFFGSVVGGTQEKPIVIKNVSLQNIYVLGHEDEGGLIGTIEKPTKVSINDSLVSWVTIENVSVDGRVSGHAYMGGIVGLACYVHLTMNNVNTSGKVFASGALGGLIGHLYIATLDLSNAYNEAKVNGFPYSASGTYYAGGIIGFVSASLLKMENVYNEGYIEGSGGVGGLIGYFQGGSSLGRSSILNAYNIGPLEGSKYYAGLVGEINGATLDIKNSYSYSYKWLEYESENSEIDTSLTDPLYNIIVDSTTDVELDNVLYAASQKSKYEGSLLPTLSFANGEAASILHHYENGDASGSVWGQNIGVDMWPNFTSKLEGDADGKIFSLLTLNMSYLEEASVKNRTYYVEGVQTDLPIVKRDDYAFKGWFDNADCEGDPVTVIPDTATGSMTLYGCSDYVQHNVNVTIVSDSMGTVTGGGLRSSGSEVSLRQKAKNCYEFVRWESPYGISSDTGYYRLGKLQEDVDVSVYFRLVEYPINYHLAGAILDSASRTHNCDEVVALTTPHKDGYEFVAWYGNSELTGESVDSIATGISSSVDLWPMWVQSFSQSSSSAQSSPEVATSSSNTLESSSSEGAYSSSNDDTLNSSNSRVSLVQSLLKSNIHVDGRYISIHNSKVNDDIILLDMQGRVLQKIRMNSDHVDVYVAFTGRFLLKVGSRVFPIEIR